MKSIPRLIVVLGLVTILTVLALGITATASAQQPTPNVDDEVLRISKSLYCPVCTGVPLDVCETQACVQWRALIREKLVAGENESQIRAYFIAQYGERVLGAPPPEGFNLGAYILPALALVLGAVVIFWTTRSWLKHPQTEAVTEQVPHVSPEYAERIARELKARE
jgi:cytochrome c-type biogenesis protein CcmH